MRSLSVPLIAVVFAMPGLAQEPRGTAPRELPPDFIKVDLRGELRLSPSPKEKQLRGQVAVRSLTGEKCYELEFPAGKALRKVAEKLDRQTVLITGELFTIFDTIVRNSPRQPPRDIIRVKSLKAAGSDK